MIAIWTEKKSKIKLAINNPINCLENAGFPISNPKAIPAPNSPNKAVEAPIETVLPPKSDSAAVPKIP